MRHSIVPNRTSYAASVASQVTNAAQMNRLLEKKKEYEAVAALERASTLLVKRIEGIADDCEVMADASRGLVLCLELAFLSSQIGVCSAWPGPGAMV